MQSKGHCAVEPSVELINTNPALPSTTPPAPSHQTKPCPPPQNRTQQHAEAVCLARQAVQLQPSCARLRHTLGRVHEKARPPRWAEAADAYSHACEKDPRNVQMLLDLARVLKELDRHGRAAEAYGRAVALSPDHPRAHFKLAMVLRQMGRGERAVAHFRWGLWCCCYCCVGICSASAHEFP